MTALDDAKKHLADDGALNWTVGTREEYLEQSHELLVAVVKEATAPPPPCKHARTRGTAGSGTGGSFSEWWCQDCGHHERHETPPTPEQAAILALQPQN